MYTYRAIVGAEEAQRLAHEVDEIKEDIYFTTSRQASANHHVGCGGGRLYITEGVALDKVRALGSCFPTRHSNDEAYKTTLLTPRCIFHVSSSLLLCV